VADVAEHLANSLSRKTRSRLDRLIRDGTIQCGRKRRPGGFVYLFCKPYDRCRMTICLEAS